jgi:peptidoglycan/xylan/chitin deacetylase (PgdA/CDA1 family)
MASQGHEIGSHSRTHADLTLLSDAQVRDEVTGAKADLVRIGITPTSIAFPYGTYNSLVDKVVRDSGYLAARTALIADGGYNYKDTDRFHLKTQSVEQATTLDDIKAMIDSSIQNKTWLILVLHEVDNSGSQYSTSPSKLQQIVDYLKLKNASVVTVSQVLAQMAP